MKSKINKKLILELKKSIYDDIKIKVTHYIFILIIITWIGLLIGTITYIINYCNLDNNVVMIPLLFILLSLVLVFKFIYDKYGYGEEV